MIKTADGKEILEDGERLSLGVIMMDSVQKAVVASTVLANDAAIGHRPGSLAMTDADRDRRTALYRDHDKKLSERWQSPPLPANRIDTKRPTGDARLNA